jgi:hypothetical protein
MHRSKPDARFGQARVGALKVRARQLHLRSTGPRLSPARVIQWTCNLGPVCQPLPTIPELTQHQELSGWRTLLLSLALPDCTVRLMPESSVGCHRRRTTAPDGGPNVPRLGHLAEVWTVICPRCMNRVIFKSPTTREMAIRALRRAGWQHLGGGWTCGKCCDVGDNPASQAAES